MHALMSLSFELSTPTIWRKDRDMAVRLGSRRAQAVQTGQAVQVAQAAPAAQPNVVTFRALKECVQLAVQHGEICLKLPVIGDVCVDIPDFIPDGTVVEACAELGFPACVKLTVKAF